jgi:hypothetical protein
MAIQSRGRKHNCRWLRFKMRRRRASSISCARATRRNLKRSVRTCTHTRSHMHTRGLVELEPLCVVQAALELVVASCMSFACRMVLRVKERGTTPSGCLHGCHLSNLLSPTQRALGIFCSGALPLPMLADDGLHLIRDPADAAEHQEHSTHDRHAPPVRHKQPQRGRLSSLWNILTVNG